MNTWVAPTIVASRCCAPSSPTSSPPRSRSARNHSSIGTISAFPARPSATTWRFWRPRATSPSRTPVRAGCPPRRATASSSTGSTTSSRCRPSERRAILGFLESGVDLDDVLRRAVRLLAQLTRQVAIVQYPTLSTSSVRHLEVVALTPARLLLVVITDTGRVDQRIVELGDALDEHDVAKLRDLLGPGAGRQAAGGRIDRGLRPGLPPQRSRRAGRRGRPVGHGAGGDAGRAQRGAPAAGRHRQPHPQHRRLRRVAALGARSARGAGGGAAAAGGCSRRRARSPCASATRPRPRRWRAPR